ncbi:MAG: ABC transporter substrate-binding protein, partial [Bdellovibrionales bacterium]|nr:ABC transporter substrate-binding protein [Bdellovibrionales bacterium]
LEEDYAPGTSDFRSVLLRLRGKNPDALFINTQAEPTFAVVLTELERMGWQLPRYGAYWPGSKSLQEVAGKSLDGIVFVDLPNLDDVLGSDGKQLLARYRQQGGKIRSIETSFATAIEGFRALDQALQAKEKSAVAFLASTEFKGMFGPYHFDDRGEIEGLSFALKVIRDGQAQSLH